MAMRPILPALGGALALSACVSSADYAYCYDPYLGPRGYYYGPFEPRPYCPGPAAGSTYYLGPYEAGYRGPYISGPYERPAPEPSALLSPAKREGEGRERAGL